MSRPNEPLARDRASDPAPHLHDQLRQRLSALCRQGRTQGPHRAEVDQILLWLTGFSAVELEAQIAAKSDFATFFAVAPMLNPARSEIKGVVCGVRVEAVEEPLMREIRYLDKLIDELAKGKAMDKILRRPG
ncbi:DUF2200 domain-containing protein [Caulobacter vibrioides]|uniref:DUF2200 domain-containing protein n=1 Tax=Caulobacter vibrioides TaxID=155892 RepID=UPI001E5A22D6|nr:DUF2200 domain-containing protein [Caulobacter vibrioides]